MKKISHSHWPWIFIAQTWRWGAESSEATTDHCTEGSRFRTCFRAHFWTRFRAPLPLPGSASDSRLASGLHFCFRTPFWVLLLLLGSASSPQLCFCFRDPLPGSAPRLQSQLLNFSPSSLIQSEDYHLPLIVFLTIIEKSEWFFLLIGSSPEIISEKFCFSENHGG